jgi:hypothetical protein
MGLMHRHVTAGGSPSAFGVAKASPVLSLFVPKLGNCC